jgi:hypothetical protein
METIPISGVLAKMLPPHPPPDLRSQLEELFGEVWAGEANWRFDDRLDLAISARGEQHSCNLPKLGEHTWTRLTCPDCGARWVHRGFQWWPDES